MATHQLQVRCRPVKVCWSEIDVLPLSYTAKGWKRCGEGSTLFHEWTIGAEFLWPDALPVTHQPVLNTFTGTHPSFNHQKKRLLREGTLLTFYAISPKSSQTERDSRGENANISVKKQ